MDIPPPHPQDPPERLYAQARLLYERCEEMSAVIAGIRAYVEPWRTDKRMRIMHGDAAARARAARGAALLR